MKVTRFMSARSRVSMPALILLTVLVAVSLSSCAYVWNWLWARETDGPPPLPVHPDNGNAETTIVFEGGIEFDEGVRHAGTDIYYVGKSDSPNRNRIVVIDPGHQSTANTDKEAVGPGSSELVYKVSTGATGVQTGQPEYDLNLEVAIHLRNILYRDGYSVVMIRETNDVDISNKTRAQIANKYNEYQTAIFIRIHANSWVDEDMNGAMTICQSPRNPYPSCAAHYNKSRLLSELVLEHYCAHKDIPFEPLPVREMDDKSGINWSEVPTTIIEMGFLSNPLDDRNLEYPYVREAAAAGIANGIRAYYDYMEGILPETTPETESFEAIEPGTEPTTDPGTEPATEPGTEPTTDPGTEPTTEPGTEPTTEPETNPTHPGTDIYYEGKSDSPNRDYIVVIDPGHQSMANTEMEPNGPDATEEKIKVSGGTQGCVTGQPEHEVNLDVGLRLRDILLTQGYTVVMTRETADVNISNKERAEIANKYAAETGKTVIFVRIHANGWTDDTWRGALTICQSSANPYPTCAAHYTESRRLAEILLDRYCDQTGIEKRSVLEMDNQTGHNWSRVPTATVEMGFLTNAEEDALLAQSDTRQKAARGIANGIDAYFAALNT